MINLVTYYVLMDNVSLSDNPWIARIKHLRPFWILSSVPSRMKCPAAHFRLENIKYRPIPFMFHT